MIRHLLVRRGRPDVDLDPAERSLRWRLRHQNPRGLSRADYLREERIADAARKAAEGPRVPWPHEQLEARGRALRASMPVARTKDQIASELNRQAIAEGSL